MQIISNTQPITKVETIKTLIPQSRRKIGVPSLEGIHLIQCDTIMYCQADGNYTKIFLSDGSSLMSSKGLKYIEKCLPKTSFIRTHQSFIVNINEVIKIDALLLLSNKKEIPIARSKKSEVKKWFQHLVMFVE